MDRDKLIDLLQAVKQQKLSPAKALEQLKSLPYLDLGFAKIDSHRSIRQGLPEVIFCPGKAPEQIVKIAQELKARHSLVIATRCLPAVADAVVSLMPGARYDKTACLIIWGEAACPSETSPEVAVVAAGTADLPVAEEAALVLEAASVRVSRHYDVGVAGLHRLLAGLESLRRADVACVVAGMDGALASVIGGLLECPIIAVPTSVGYGASFQGVSALLTMLNSCAAGLTVVNIDNGFGAAAAALRIVSQGARLSSSHDVAYDQQQAI